MLKRILKAKEILTDYFQTIEQDLMKPNKQGLQFFVTMEPQIWAFLGVKQEPPPLPCSLCASWGQVTSTAHLFCCLLCNRSEFTSVHITSYFCQQIQCVQQNRYSILFYIFKFLLVFCLSSCYSSNSIQILCLMQISLYVVRRREAHGLWVIFTLLASHIGLIKLPGSSLWPLVGTDPHLLL